MTFKVKDHYFNKAKKDNFLARSVYKLEEIDKKFSIISKGDSIVDLGYHPGSWVQYCMLKVGEKGSVVGIDIKEVNETLGGKPNVSLFQKDIDTVESIADLGLSDKIDVLLSDMAPNTSGIKSLDQDRSLNLVEKVFELLPLFLKEDGNLVIKVFDGNGAQKFLKEKKSLFKEFHFLRPKSTRSVSKEFFVIGKNFRHDRV
ncbi:MAG: RlmE family RNA methyltransferase [Bacteriovoracaceae bacterium]|jgi:23S rRNA (uridine2552-2'-O)-methyltransferase|nr:RlmE family RNA methyltransferase [Bacteriovoracaceae bacterium]